MCLVFYNVAKETSINLQACLQTAGINQDLKKRKRNKFVWFDTTDKDFASWYIKFELKCTL